MLAAHPNLRGGGQLPTAGAQPIDKFTSVIDEQLAAAKAAIASGTKADKVSVKLAGENKAKAPAAPERPKKDDKPAEDDTTGWQVPVGTSAGKG